MNIIKITARVKDQMDSDFDILIPGDKLSEWLSDYGDDVRLYEHTTLTIESVGYLPDEYLLK